MPDEVTTLTAELARLDEEIGRNYRARVPILQRLAELRGPAELPPARYRTETQQRVARCPRCGGRLDSDRVSG